MSAKQGGSFATLLLAIPLSAIPLMAIFGIPEFAHVSAATDETVPDIVRQPSTSFDKMPLFPATVGGDASGWHSDLSPDAATQSVEATSAPGDAAGQQLLPRPMQTAAAEPLIRTTATAESTLPLSANPGGLSWREAARKLEEVGITNYRLERGESPDRFLFVCLFSPGQDERIIQRFESEAAEPLEAVEDVLVQVDQWLQHRYADSRQWLP